MPFNPKFYLQALCLSENEKSKRATAILCREKIISMKYNGLQVEIKDEKLIPELQNKMKCLRLRLEERFIASMKRFISSTKGIIL